MFNNKANANEYYTGLIAISVAVGFLTHNIAIAFIIVGTGTMLASFIK